MIEAEELAADLFDAARDAITVQWTKRVEGTEHEQDQRPWSTSALSAGALFIR